MGIDFLVNLEDEIEILDEEGFYSVGTQQFIYEVNNLDLADTLIRVLDPKYIYNPIRRYSSNKGYFNMVLMDIIDYKPLDRIVMPAKGRKTKCLVEGCWWGWLESYVNVDRRILVNDECGYIKVSIEKIETMGLAIVFDDEYSSYEYDERDCIKEVQKPLYEVYLKKPCYQGFLIDELPRILRFLEQNYPIIEVLK